ncbi:hypothetical protein RO575_19925 [Methylomonas sp. MO1]|uniref:hypothetical protein n=1 Tax=unclassified Methylomonas TaxID=2608980 RepID=UPI00047A3430|nr:MULTISPECIES: hypothetical protein [unclassified Methylomonas]MDT4291839.1 hypothetical protein [Methylomonas sp. MO1]
MDAETLEEKELISLERTKLERERLEFEQKKLQRMTIGVSTVAVLVSLLQVGIAYLQSRLSTAQTVEKFIPYLQKQETRDAALLTMSGFVDQQFVTQLAEKSRATTVLETFQVKGSEREKSQATAALSELDRKRRVLIDKIFDSSKPARIEATTELIRQWSTDPNIIPQLIEVASAKLANQSGIVNTLVILRETPPDILRANAEDLASFLSKAKLNGHQTAGLVTDVENRATASR